MCLQIMFCKRCQYYLFGQNYGLIQRSLNHLQGVLNHNLCCSHLVQLFVIKACRCPHSAYSVYCIKYVMSSSGKGLNVQLASNQCLPILTFLFLIVYEGEVLGGRGAENVALLEIKC